MSNKKYIILVPDGMADESLPELGGKTPLESAKTPHMDFLAAAGLSALVKTIPDGMSPGSDVGNLALLGYDPRSGFSGRAPLEAASMGIQLQVDEIAFRCNLITEHQGLMQDYSAGHISSEEAKELIEYLQKVTQESYIRFYPGKSYRHLMVVKTKNLEAMLKVKTKAPHDILNQPIKEYLPSGEHSESLLKLMEQSRQILEKHPVNQARMKAGLSCANMIWLWGQGGRPQLPLFKNRYGLTGSVISAVDLVNGIAALIGLKIISVPGANGYYDTNYQGKAEYAIDSLKEHDFVYVHVEAPDEAGHNGDYKAKIECIEKFDQYVVGTVREYLKVNKDVRVLISPDHPTPVKRRTHTSSPVPFVIYGQGIASNGVKEYSEIQASKAGIKFSSGQEMIQYFFKN